MKIMIACTLNSQMQVLDIHKRCSRPPHSLHRSPLLIENPDLSLQKCDYSKYHLLKLFSKNILLFSVFLKFLWNNGFRNIYVYFFFQNASNIFR